MLTIRTGGTLVTSFTAVGNLPGSTGTVIVTDPGSNWSNAGSIVVGGQGTGTFTIQNGGTVSSGGGSVGLSAGSNGTVTVTGAGSSWINGPSNGLNIGSFGTGTLAITNGGRVIDITPLVTNIGNGAGSHGSVRVAGAGSLWSDIAGFNIGNLGTGMLTIAEGGVVTAPAVVIATNAGSIGTLNIGAAAGDPAAAPGTLTAPSVAFGAGTGTINFNHTSSNYVFAPAISGNGAVNVLAGTTIFTGANTYTGGTTISAGTLQLGNGGTSGSITGNVTNNGIFAINRSDAVSFGGVISGSGAFQQNGTGTTIFTGANSYTGGTTISAGTLQLGNGGTSGSITGNVTNNGIFAINRSDAFSFGGVISGSGAFQQNGTGTTIFTGANSYSGATNVTVGTLQAGAPNTFSPTSAVRIASGGTLDLNGFSQTVPSVINAGLVNMGSGTAPRTIFTTTSYIGTGGTIAMNTFLGRDGSPSDRLVINGGSATGSSLLRITNAGGPGAETVANGIAVVQAINGGTTATGAFTLVG